MSPYTVDEKLPLRDIPGDYGLPYIGAVKDRYNYFYNEGEHDFFSTRIDKYKSTVFRTNMPPGPLISSNPRVVAVLDAVSFPVLFDNSKVEKRDVLDGTYMPSLAFTGNYRALAYLDPNEEMHEKLKTFFHSALAARHDKLIPLLRSSLSDHLFAKLEENNTGSGTEKLKIDFNAPTEDMSFDYVFRLFCDGKDPSETKLGSKGPSIGTIWLGLQLSPLVSGLAWFIPTFLDDLILHTVKFPYFIVRSGYKKLYDAFSEGAKSMLDEAEKQGIKRDEACHNLIFMAVFNAFGGMKFLFPQLIKWVGGAGEKVHQQLADEIRTVVNSEGGGVTFESLDEMTLTKSVVYEALRMEPPVAYQYAKAREDLIINSHDAKFEIKKGEMLFGYQPFATHDPKIFDRPDEFVPDRFVGEGEELLKYVYWSNGRETEDQSSSNKQCLGKDLVVMMSRVMLVEFFLRYDTFTMESTIKLLNSMVTITSLTKASYT